MQQINLYITAGKKQDKSQTQCVRMFLFIFQIKQHNGNIDLNYFIFKN